MPISIDEIIEQTRQMPADAVASLVDRILREQHGGIAPEVEAAWKSEIQIRINEIESGKVQALPIEESLARARKIAGL